jgi:hypothetical protein
MQIKNLIYNLHDSINGKIENQAQLSTFKPTKRIIG